jgi:hypothetical protein
MPGRIEAYIHSDSVTPNKGGCLVEVQCQTDFAARTDAFIGLHRLRWKGGKTDVRLWGQSLAGVGRALPGP